MPKSASTLEILWTIPSALGLVVAVYLLWLVLGDDYYQMHHAGNKEERIWSRSQVWAKIERLTILLIMTFFGLLALATPPTIKNPPPPGRVAYGLTIVFILIPTILTAGAIRTLIDRRRILSAIRRGQGMRRRRTDGDSQEVATQ